MATGKFSSYIIVPKDSRVEKFGDLKEYTNKQAAQKLYLSVKTVETYRARIMEKLQLRTRVELVRYAIQEGFLI